MNVKLSVIIPVYNTKDTLSRTINSVINQTHRNIQIILVDDESPDGAGVLCDEYASKYDNIQVIHKKNQGLGMARNSGLDIAEGEYIAFLDSDDWLEPEAYEECIEALDNNNCDACYYGRKVYREDGSYLTVSAIPNKLLFKDSSEVISEFAPRYFGDPHTRAEDAYIRESSCCAMYKASIIKDSNIRFMSERKCLSEDLFFNLHICRVAEGIMIIPKNYYNQGFNPSSLTRRYDDTRFDKMLSMYGYLEDYARMFTDIPDAVNRSRYKIISATRGLIRDEASLRYDGVVSTYKRISNIINNPIIQNIYHQFEDDGYDKRTSTYIGWVKNRRAITVFMFYLIKGLCYH